MFIISRINLYQVSSDYTSFYTFIIRANLIKEAKLYNFKITHYVY